MKLKLLSGILALTLILGISTQAFAAGHTEDSVESCTVTLFQVSDFSVTIPKSITLNGTSGTGSYYVSLSGNISGTETVSVVPSESVTLAQTGKPSLTALVGQYTDSAMAQTKTLWDCGELVEGAEAYGYIHLSEATPITAGHWTGTMLFTITLTDGQTPTPDPDPEPEPEPDRIPETSWDASFSIYDNVTASLYDNDGYYSLEFAGTGRIKDFSTQMWPAWANYRSSVSSIIIGDGITEIGDKSLQLFSAATSLTMADSVTSIGGASFMDMKNLRSVTIPRNVITIGSYAFNGCSALTSVSIRSTGLSAISNGAFTGIASGSSIFVPNATIAGRFTAGTHYIASSTTISVDSSLGS